MHHLLLVDDEPSILNALQRALRARLGHLLKMDLCTSGEAALQKALARPYDLVLSDLRMPRMDGIEFLTRLACIQPHSVRMILTGTADFATAQRAVNEIGIYRYLTKPWLEEELVDHLRTALAYADDARQQREQADAWAADQGTLSPQEAERRRLEALEPGLTLVEWGADGAVLMPPLEGWSA